MKKRLALLLAALLLTALGGCAKEPVDEALVGTWQAQWNMAEKLEQTLKEKKLEAVLEQLDLSAAKVAITLTFAANNRYSATVDAGAINKLLDAMKKVGQTLPEAESAFAAAGLDISAITKTLATLFPERDEQEQKATLEGKYKAENGLLTIGIGKTLTLYLDGPISYTVSEDTLELASIEEKGEVEVTLGKLLPLVFKKA